MVKLSVVVPFSGTVAPLKAIVMDGGLRLVYTYCEAKVRPAAPAVILDVAASSE